MVTGKDENCNILDTIEYLTVGNDGNPTATTWKMCTATLSTTRWYPGVAVIIDCLIIMGGANNYIVSLKSAEVFDTKRNVCWNLPGMNEKRYACVAVTLEESKVIATGGWVNDCDKLHASMEVLECFATIENVDKHIEQATEQWWLGKKHELTTWNCKWLHSWSGRMQYDSILTSSPKIKWAVQSCTMMDGGATVAEAIWNGQAIAVSDGSYKDHFGTAAYVLEGDTDDHHIVAVMVVPGDHHSQSPFCSELVGLYGIIHMVDVLCKT